MNGHVPHNYTAPSLLVSPSPQPAGDVEPPALETANPEADEPPEPHELPPLSPIANHFKRAPVGCRGSEHESLLSRALHSQSEEDAPDSGSVASIVSRRRSVTSTVSMASSSTELAYDTAVSTPARTASPSPRISQAPFHGAPGLDAKAGKGGGVPVATLPSAVKRPALATATAELSADPAVAALQKKRCISFACDSTPKVNNGGGGLIRPRLEPRSDTLGLAANSEGPAAKCTSIKFACTPSRPREDASILATPLAARSSTKATGPGLPPSSKPQNPATTRRSSPGDVTDLTKKLVADAQDPQSESARFYEFASDDLQEDDWIRRDGFATKWRITIGDTLEKEYAISKLGKEAEEEADLEELDDLDEDEDHEDKGEPSDDEDNEDDDGDNEAEEELGLDDQDSTYGSDGDISLDGYHTDNEVGFADSDDSDDDLVLWTAAAPTTAAFTSAAAQGDRRRSADACSDSSLSSNSRHGIVRTRRTRPVTFRPGTPELPDSTDFVCGTLDEDRPMEEAYLSCVAARKREKMNLIPQDIDPSFPASEPEDEGEDTLPVARGNSDEHIWFHGSLEDLHSQPAEHGLLGHGRVSPKRCRSPPPPTSKRLHSPPPPSKARGRSPRRPLPSPTRQLRPPAAAVHQLGLGKARTGFSPSNGHQRSELGIVFQTTALPLRSLGGAQDRPSSVPKTASMLPLPRNHPHHHHHHHHHHKGTTHRKAGRAEGGDKQPKHVRGAIDIVKGLEQKTTAAQGEVLPALLHSCAKREDGGP